MFVGRLKLNQMKCSWILAQVIQKDARNQNNNCVFVCVCVCAGSAEAADQLGTNGKLVERLVEWCEAKDHAGVMGESNRLLSALIRHSKSKVRRFKSGNHTAESIININVVISGSREDSHSRGRRQALSYHGNQ